MMMLRLVIFVCAAIHISAALASDARLAVPQSAATSVFVSEIERSESLSRNDLKVGLDQYASEDAILEAVLNGSADVGLVIDALIRHKFESQPTLASIFTHPFLFQNTQDLFDLQQSALRTAIFADISRTRLIPLAFWNGGNENIITTLRLDEPSDFAKLRIGIAGANAGAAMLTRLGATQIALPSAEVLPAVSQGRTNATVAHDLSTDFYKSVGTAPYITPFRPLVGILFAGPKYWEALPERDKRAWVFAAGNATKNANQDVYRQAAFAEKIGKVQKVQLSVQQKIELLTTVFPNDPTITEQANLVKQTLDRVHSQPGKKRLKMTDLLFTRNRQMWFLSRTATMKGEMIFPLDLALRENCLGRQFAAKSISRST